MKKYVFSLLLLLLAYGASAQKILSGEYFFDADPGFGKGLALSFTPADTVSFNDSIPTTGLSLGIHVLYVRMKDSLRHWSLFEGRMFYLQTPPPLIVKGEYFYDTDPGFGKGQALASFSPTDTIAYTDSLPTTGLSVGIHNLYTRFMDANGKWSHYEGRMFYLQTPPPLIVKGEYFYDTDPGFGKATALASFSPTDTIAYTDSLPTTGLSVGIHNLYTRFMDANGKWSHYEGRMFYVENPPSLLVKGEYFYDTDPGLGKATALASFSPADTVVLNDSLSTAGLSTGIHNLYTRFMNANGKWGLYEGRTFYVENPPTPIVKGEYFYDTDPGLGKGTTLASFIPADTVLLNDSLPTTRLDTGLHTLYVRFEDANGKWGLFEGRTFRLVQDNDAGIASILSPASAICVGTAPVTVLLKNFSKDTLTSVTVNWQLDGVPQTAYSWTGILTSGSTTNITLSSGYSFVAGTHKLVAYTSLPNGGNDINPGNDSVKFNITVNAPPNANAGSSQAICESDSASIGAIAVVGDNYSWVSSPAGFNSTLSNPVVKPNTTTSYTLTETVGTCTKSNSVTITVNPLPVADAGSNQTTCAGTSVSIGASSVTGSGYSWISAPAGFTSTSPDPVVNPSVKTIYALTETIKATGCAKTDSVIIFVNPSPNANAGIAQIMCIGDSAKIGETAVGGDTYSWVSSPSGFSSTLSNPYVKPSSTTTYTLTETAGSCTKSNSVEITVSPLPIAGWSVSNTSQNYNFKVSDSSLSKSSYTWDFGDGSANTNGYDVSHVFPKNTKYTVKLTVTNASGCISVHDSVISVTISAINPSINPDYSLSIYPNPFTDKTLVNFTLPEDAHVRISVMDVKGNTLNVLADKILSSGNNNIEINATKTGLMPGTYFVNMEINGQFISKKIIEVW